MTNTIFELEQKIMQFSNITEDLKILAEKIEDPIVADKILNIVIYYNFKYDDLWECFEAHCKEAIKKST